MQHASILMPDDDLRGAERRVVAILRAWTAGPDAQIAIWEDLSGSLGEARARSCLQAFEQMLGLFKKHSWNALTIMPVGIKGLSQDEAAIARFVMAATEQRRETALAEASFIVSATALLPILCAASRFGLPLLCEECRTRIFQAALATPPN
ncbi:hypothetical protein [Marivita sp. XM-24bin2]|uniref:hypothetical protein n=1 Tax=unclassified Marivita TaxID=2632480 RepID=UPI000D7A64E9|nr:hypothetical protein [Marivita sp. XM-24bin2]MCR9109750.1 hypothetical protein [Paracoccaceae bacterium]PWL36241.1 MAG: hypothetical protein DCO97_05580 [Marivita sp. XM-24bin2]